MKANEDILVGGILGCVMGLLFTALLLGAITPTTPPNITFQVSEINKDKLIHQWEAKEAILVKNNIVVITDKTGATRIIDTKDSTAQIQLINSKDK